MFTRLLLAVILSALGAHCASAGVLVSAEQTPQAVNSMSMPVEDDSPIALPALEKGDLACEMTLTSSYSGASSVAMSDWTSMLPAEAPLSEVIRVWSSTLPTCPFLESKLKPA
ncbi:hypothetical protein [Allorhodopirellula heiligendammensis]|uniref:Ig-like domain-containing protein n=1 Tax=Allorhodopirellula heiligendammensis TaxID=2714739 RepID=A0A5C6C7B0_9BACT|nr:hypothetical protein [Allorhodopirellula heiligendammensis]TWU19985.1 hypothetical protein Poly21_21640 [Allorhodopirellula heiligendammensis]